MYSCTPDWSFSWFYPYEKILSRTPDRDFRCFYPCEIILSHISKIKKEQLHGGCTSICDVIVMLKLHHHVASQHNQDFPEVFFMWFQYKMRYLVVSKKTIHYSCEVGIEKYVPRDHRLSSINKPCDANRWSSGQIFLSHPHTHDGFLLSRVPHTSPWEG